MDIIKDDLNLKSVEMRDDVREFTSYTFKPQLKTVGPKYGKNLGFIKQYLADVNGNEALNELNNKGVLSFDAPDGTRVELGRDDLLIDVSKQGGYVTEEDRNVTVVLDTNLTEELINEGFMREIISKVQTMRKEAGFEVMDHIIIGFKGSERITGIAESFKDTICHDCMADDMRFDSLSGYQKAWDINGEQVELSVEKLA